MLRPTGEWASVVAAACLLAAPLPAQEGAGGEGAAVRSDTARVLGLDGIVVTAERTASPLGASVSAVSVVEGARLRALPDAGLAGALRSVPGFVLVDFDGLGHDPQPMVRGFYGGGEAEYLLVLVDGKPVNDLAAGLMAWELVPPVAVERIEVVRGAASAVYGDAAIGGVVNVITDRDAAGTRWELSAAEHGTLRGGVRTDGRHGSGGWSLFGGGLRTDGFREHGERTSFSAGGSVDLAMREDGRLSLSAASLRREIEDPGPLPGPQDGTLPGTRRRSEPFYRFDRRDEWIHRAALDAGTELGGGGATVSGSLAAEARRVDAVETIPLSPDFADTKARRLDTDRAALSALLGWRGLLVGVDASAGRLDSEYLALLNGGPDAYDGAGPAPGGEVDARGEGARRTAAAFARYEARPWPALRVSVGARMDWLRDTFEPRAPSDGEPSEAGHSAFSPRAGANLRWLATDRQRGHVYVAWSRSFKAPTPDQLFDQRSIPVPFPPFAATTSNPLLDPQRGVSLEAGMYHDAVLVPGALAVGGSVAAYRMDLEDELDFDLQTLRYVNIGRSRHRGVEAGVRLEGPSGAELFVSYTLQEATARQGENAGNRLKAIPRHFVSAGLQGAPARGVATGLWITRAGSAWLDDANTSRLPAWTRVDARLSVDVGAARLVVEARNLLDRAYGTTGFPDPSGSGVVYRRPAACRTLSLGMSAGG